MKDSLDARSTTGDHVCVPGAELLAETAANLVAQGNHLGLIRFDGQVGCVDYAA